MSIADKLKTVAQKMEDVYRTGLFKYAQKSTASGESILLENSAPEPFVNMKPYGHSWQNGTPTPTEPQPIESAKEIKILGENLFDGKALVDSGCFTENDGVYTSVELRDQVIWRNTENITEQMVLSFKYKQHTNAMGYMFVIVYTDGAIDRAYTNKVYGEWDSVVLVTNEEKVVSHMELYYSAGDTITSFNDIWLEIGTEVHGNAQTLILPNFHGIGDVRDHVDYDRKKLVRRYAEINPSTLDWYAIDTSRYYCDIPNIKERSVTENNGHSLFTHGEYKNAIWSDSSKTGYVINNTNLHVRDASVRTLEELLAKIQDSVLLYELAEPIETDLTDEQIYAFKRLRANSPNTTIIGQGKVDVTYIVDNRQ